MRLSTTAQYGLMAAGYIAEHTGEGWVLATRIAEEYGISMLYLLKIMQRMVKTNILRSKRGPGGGYILARPAKEITLVEIIETVDGPIASRSEMVELTGKAPFSVEMEKVCDRACERAASILGRAKLSQMLR